MTKTCTKCVIEKELSNFSFRKERNSYNSICKECMSKKQNEHYLKNREKILQQSKIYEQEHKEKIKKRKKDYYLKNKKQLLLNRKNRYLNNREHELQICKNYEINNKEKINERKRKRTKIRRKTDINFKIRHCLASRLIEAIKENWKSGHTLELLGCSIEFLKKHLEAQFKEGMNWDNHNKQGWEIDHIRPCASFDFNKESEQRKCFHYTNLQPMWAEENLKKSDKWEESHERPT